MVSIEKYILKLPWEDGRQNTGYKKIKLLESKRFLFDVYLLYYSEETLIPRHTDKVDQGRHYRLNCTIKKAVIGGKFLLEAKPIFSWWRFVVFRPDLDTHCVSKIIKGYRVVLSIGWVKKQTK
ncbi:MAG: 2OG-Fe(II) oxygenase [Crocinitomicaceae bacterium]|nr:MAG: 2OG-Fe(II) oxygenase [Crocinitomicaceae bacterium]